MTFVLIIFSCHLIWLMHVCHWNSCVGRKICEKGEFWACNEIVNAWRTDGGDSGEHVTSSGEWFMQGWRNETGSDSRDKVMHSEMSDWWFSEMYKVVERGWRQMRSEYHEGVEQRSFCLFCWCLTPLSAQIGYIVPYRGVWNICRGNT